MKIEEYLKAKLEPELRKALEEKSKEELIESIIGLTVSYCAITVNSFELSARLHKSALATNQQALCSPFPDWSDAMFKGAAQVCELRKGLIDESRRLDIEAIKQEMLKKRKKDEEDSKGFATDKK